MIETQTIQALLVTAAWTIPVITGIVEVIKRTLELDSRFVPVASVFVGVATGLAIIDLSVLGGFVGLVFGLSGVGLWEAGKTSVLGK